MDVAVTVCIFKLLLTVLTEADKVGMDWEKDTKVNKAIHTNEDREIIVYSDAKQLQPRHDIFQRTRHKTVQQKISQLDAVIQSKQLVEMKETHLDKGWKRDGEEGERQLTVCRWFIIVVIWRGFLLTTRPTLVLLSSFHLLPVCRSHWHIFK